MSLVATSSVCISCTGAPWMVTRMSPTWIPLLSAGPPARTAWTRIAPAASVHSSPAVSLSSEGERRKRAVRPDLTESRCPHRTPSPCSRRESARERPASCRVAVVSACRHLTGKDRRRSCQAPWLPALVFLIANKALLLLLLPSPASPSGNPSPTTTTHRSASGHVLRLAAGKHARDALHDVAAQHLFPLPARGRRALRPPAHAICTVCGHPVVSEDLQLEEIIPAFSVRDGHRGDKVNIHPLASSQQHKMGKKTVSGSGSNSQVWVQPPPAHHRDDLALRRDALPQCVPHLSPVVPVLRQPRSAPVTVFPACVCARAQGNSYSSYSDGGYRYSNSNGSSFYSPQGSGGFYNGGSSGHASHYSPANGGDRRY